MLCLVCFWPTSSPGRFFLALEAGREKALGSAGHMTTKHPDLSRRKGKVQRSLVSTTSSFGSQKPHHRHHLVLKKNAYLITLFYSAFHKQHVFLLIAKNMG